MQVIYVDNHLLLVVKPSGLATQTPPEGGDSLEVRAKLWIKEKYKKPGAVFLQPIHRLDKPVSGLVLFARTSKALSRLQQQMRDRQMEKIYIASVEGTLSSADGTLEHYLIHESHHARIGSPTHPDAKHAILTYRTLPSGQIEIHLHTGRYHQIRAQFSAIGHPIKGDARYGSKTASPALALHHYRLTFTHPISGQRLTFTKEP